MWRSVPETRRLALFQAANALNFPIALGAPAVLMTRSWGASPFYIGALAAMVPLLATLQIYSGPRVEYWGFRRTMTAGWGSRTAALALVAALPFLSMNEAVSHHFLLDAFFVLMLFFNALRGLGSSAWGPWIVQLVPDEWRGRYLATEQRLINASSIAIVIASGWLLGRRATGLEFGMLYVFAVAAGSVSVWAISRVPCSPPRQGPIKLEPVTQWFPRVWSHRPLKRMVRMHSAFWLATGGASSFCILYLRDVLGMSDMAILWISGAATLGAISASGIWGALCDRFGAKPVIAIGSRLLLADWFGWAAMAAGLLPPRILLIVFLFIGFGAGLVGYTIGVNRYCMNNFGPEDITLHFTVFSVTGSLAAGVSPLLWGRMIDETQTLANSFGAVEVNGYSLYFGLSMAALALTKILIRRIPRRKSKPTGLVFYHLITDYPLRTLYSVARVFQTSPGAKSGPGHRSNHHD